MLKSSASLALLPARMAGVMLDAPRAAADHPRSRELCGLLDEGYTVTGFRRRRHPFSAEVTLQRGDEVREIESTDLAFAAYACQAVPRAFARAVR